MPKRLFLLLLTLILSINASATHIVGGEFELEHLQDFNYRLSLNLYFDAINGDPAALDPVIVVNIFEKGSNKLMLSQEMSIRSQSFVPYTNIACTIGSLSTRRIIYYQTIYLSPTIFTNPQGYYVTWERCCRNNTINNIVAPEGAAQTFYLEFPPVVKNGSQFINSSPILFPPLSDYACVDELFYFDFNGTDPDGDSLVYDMVTPLNGYTSQFMPAYQPNTPIGTAPYPEIRWLPGFNRTNQIQGSPPLSINPVTGRLTMRPRNKGLFVFGIRCQEFRNGIKIGEVRRDFQVLVLECPRDNSPVVNVREKDKDDFYKTGEVLRIEPTGSRCIDVYFTDPDLNEFITLKAIPVNFSSTEYTFQGPVQGSINQSGTATDTLKASLCFSDCFSTEGKVYKMDLVVQDDGCSLPRQDTLQLSFVIDPIQDTPPTLSLSTPTRIFEVTEGDILTFDVTGKDTDEQEVTLSATGKDFDLISQAINFQSGTKPSEVTSTFTWNIDCATLQKESYLIEFQVTSTVCGKPVTRTELVEVRTKYNNNIPTISTDKEELEFDLNLNEPFVATIFGSDIDKHNLVLTAAGDGFELADLGMTFTSSGGAGQATGVFQWNAACIGATNDGVRVTFTLTEDACIPAEEQTITMVFKVNAPNDKPVLTTDQTTLTFDLELNQPFEAQLFGSDINLDLLTLSYEGEGFNPADLGMTFASTEGNGTAEGLFKWVANCDAFEQGVVRVNFKLAETACAPFPEEVLTMEFRVKVPALKDFIPPNIFTPNGDGLNDYFEIPELPSDFCTEVFSGITIFNRWGQEVFRSNSHNFKWDGKGVNDGVYFYLIDFKSKEYKGSVTLVR